MADTIEVLEGQHGELLARLEGVEDRLAALAVPFLELHAYLEHEVEAHFALEESALFPILARHPALATGPLPVLQQEHARARSCIGELGEALCYGTVASQVGAVETIIDLLRAHVAKEDTVLFALARLNLSADERAELERVAGTLR